MTLLCIGDQVEPGDYTLHSRFNRAINFANGRRLVFLVDETIGAGPLNIVFQNIPSRDDTGVSAFLHVHAQVIGFGSQEFRFSEKHYYRSRLRFGQWDGGHLRRNVAVLRELLSTAAPPRSLAFLVDKRRLEDFQSGFEKACGRRIEKGVEQVFQGNLIRGIKALKGCGWGLTPSGDDFVAGVLFGLNLLQKMHGRNFERTMNTIYQAAEGTNLFSNTFLDLARRGLHFQKMKNMIMALVQEEEDAVRRSAGQLFALGGSSGADVATGFLMALEAKSRLIAEWAERPEGKDRFEPSPYSPGVSHPGPVDMEAAIA